MKKTILIISVAVAAMLLSSCVVVHPKDEYDVYVETSTKKKTPADNSDETADDTTETNAAAEATKKTGKYSITCKNQSSTAITNWCVKKDNNVTLPSAGSIKANGGEDKISDLPEGYYKIYFTFENGYSTSESITLDKDVIYCIYGNNNSYTVECRNVK